MPNRRLEAFRVGKDNDRRRKLSDSDRKELLECKGTMSRREAARAFGVSRRLVVFTWFPERLEAHKEKRKGCWSFYYTKEKHRVSMREHRTYKAVLLNNKGDK